MLWKTTSVWGSAVSWIGVGGERRRSGRAHLLSLSLSLSVSLPPAAEASEDESLVCGTCIKGSPERNFLALPLALVIREQPRGSSAAAGSESGVRRAALCRRCFSSSPSPASPEHQAHEERSALLFRSAPTRPADFRQRRRLAASSSSAAGGNSPTPSHVSDRGSALATAAVQFHSRTQTCGDIGVDLGYPGVCHVLYNVTTYGGPTTATAPYGLSTVCGILSARYPAHT